jgi:tyrosine-protein kinase Etk/Wzc
MTGTSPNQEENLHASFAHKFIPFWPLFAVLITISLAGAWAYLHYIAVPLYETSATIIIKDEKKGVDESRMTQSIDAFTSNNIVENEIKVIQSRALMQQVVDKLNLYAPIYEEQKFRAIPAYASSPIQIEVRNPEHVQEREKVHFTYLPSENKVKINTKKYPLGGWVTTPYGVMKFTRNAKQTSSTDAPLYFSIIAPKRAIDEISRNLTIQAENKLSTAVNFSLKDASPERGEAILNNLIEAYNQVAIIKRNKLAANTLDFVEKRIKMVGKELAELENKVVRYKSTQRVVNLSEQGKVFLNNVGENDRSIAEINQQLAVLDKVHRYILLKGNSDGIVPSTLGINDPVLSQLLHQLYEAETQYQRLKKTTGESNPILVSLVDEIEKLRPSILENIQNQRIALQASRANLSSTSSQYNAVLQTIPKKERELLEISRQLETKNNAYNFLLQKREETVLSYAPTAEDTRIVDMAQSSMGPVSPRPLYLYLIAAMMACVAGVALVSGSELVKGKLLFRSEIEKHTNAPIVAELAFVKNTTPGPFQAPTEAFTIEQFRQLRASLGLYGRTFSKKKIMVTSNIPGEGKTFVSTNLAYSLATSGKKVALLDFDLMKAATTARFDLEEQYGLIEFLKGEITPQAIIHPTQYDNLFVVPAGVEIGDHTELLLNGQLESLFAYLEMEFDYILVDTPPIDIVTGASLLAEYCNITLLVMRHSYTPKRILQGLTMSNKIKLLNNVAIVFNGVKPRGLFDKHYGYGYGYGHEYNYGEKAYQAYKTRAKA